MDSSAASPKASTSLVIAGPAHRSRALCTAARVATPTCALVFPGFRRTSSPTDCVRWNGTAWWSSGKVSSGTAAAAVYALTPRGEALETVIAALGRWAGPLLAEPAKGDVFLPHWLVLPARLYLTDRAPNKPPVRVEVRDGNERVTLEAAHGKVTARVGPTGTSRTRSSPGSTPLAWQLLLESSTSSAPGSGARDRRKAVGAQAVRSAPALSLIFTAVARDWRPLARPLSATDHARIRQNRIRSRRRTTRIMGRPPHLWLSR